MVEMKDTASCQVCGNEIVPSVTVCPYCGAKHHGTPGQQRQGSGCRIVNLEKNMPTTDHALNRLQGELAQAATHGCRVLVLIHGYGSSGRGGAIKKEIHRQLAFLKENGQVNDYLPGEECVKRSGHGRHILQRFPFLAEYFRRLNPGISLVIV